MAKGQFSFIEDYSSKVDEQGKIRLYSDEQRKQFKLEEDAKTKLRETQALKLQIQQETDIAVGEALAEKKKRSGFIMETLGGVQTYSDPRNWGRGLLKVGSMIIENPKDVFIDAPRGALQSKDATKLFEQSSQLNNEATRLAKTDKVRSDELFKQSQELYKSAQEKYGKANENLGQLTTGKQIAAKAALTGLDIGSLLPGGAQIKAGATGAIKGAPLLSKVVTKVPEAVQTTKTFTAGNILSNILGLGDIYQGGAKVVSRTTGKEAGKGIVGLATDAIGMGIKNTAQAPVYGTLQALADNEEDSFENIKNNILTTGASVFALTLGFGFAGNILAEGVAGTVAKNTTKKGATTPLNTTPTNAPKFQSLGAFTEDTVPILDLTKTVKGNNIDFNPDSATSVNSTINAVNKLAMFSGNQVGGKAIKIDKNSPKYKEIFDTMIKPLTDGINQVDKVVNMPNVKFEPLGDIKAIRDFAEKFEPKNQKEMNALRTFMSATGQVQSTGITPNNYSKIINNFIKNSGYTNVSKLSTKIDNNSFTVRIFEDGKPITKEIKAKPIVVSDDLNTMAHKDPVTGSGWNISEKSTGLKIASGKTQAEALKNAKEVIKANPNFKDVIETQKQKYNIQAKPETPTLSKIPIEEVELKINEIETQLRNVGIDTNPISVSDTPNMDIVDEKLARGETPTPEELDKGAKEYIENTGNPEVLEGVKQETQDRLKNSTFFGRFASKNPEAVKNAPNPQYVVQNMKDEEAYAKDLVDNNYDKAKEIVDNLERTNVFEGNANKLMQAKIAKDLELGRYEEVIADTAKLSYLGTDAGQFNAAFANSNIADPVLNITRAQRDRIKSKSKKVQAELKTVKENMSNVIIDDSTFASILDNITCR